MLADGRIVTLRGSLLATVLTLAVAIRLWVLHSLRFDGLYGQDAFAYYYHGLAIWRDHSLSYPWPWLPRPLPLFFPLGEPALLAGVFALLGRPDPTAALAVSVVCGTLSVALVYGIALRIAGCLFEPVLAAWTAALAAAPVAVAGLQVQASDTIMSDAPALFWGTAAIWLWTLPAPDAPAGGAALAAFAAGVCYALAVSTRWEYAALAIAMAAYWWADSEARPWQPFPRKRWPGPGLRLRSQEGRLGLAIFGTAENGRDGATAVAYSSPSRPVRARRFLSLAENRAYRMPVAALVGAALAGIPQFLYSVHNSDPVLHHQWLTGWSPTHLWQATFATVDGVQRYPVSVGAYYLVRPLLSPQTLPFTLAPFLPLGIAALAFGGTLTTETRRRRRRRDCTEMVEGQRERGRGDIAHSRQWLLLLLCWWLAPALYLAGVPFESARFALIYMPPLAMLEAIGLVASARALGQRMGGRAPACLAIACVGLGLGVQAADTRDGVAALARGKTGDLQAVAWLRDHTPSGATISTFGLTLMLYHYGDVAGHRWRLLDLSAASTSDLSRAARNPALTVVVNEGNLARQWQGLPPQLAFAWLQAHVRLRPVADEGGYTILRRGAG